MSECGTTMGYVVESGTVLRNYRVGPLPIDETPSSRDELRSVEAHWHNGKGTFTLAMHLEQQVLVAAYDGSDAGEERALFANVERYLRKNQKGIMYRRLQRSGSALEFRSSLTEPATGAREVYEGCRRDLDVPLSEPELTWIYRPSA